MKQLRPPKWKAKGDPIGDLLTQIGQFRVAERKARDEAAILATAETRSRFRRGPRPIAPPRDGRSGKGKMTQSLTWRPTRDGVAFDLNAANRGAEHWIIQEIGTNKRANLLRAGADASTPRRVSAGRVVTVKPQAGRVISRSLAWSSGVGGVAVKADDQLRFQHQLFLRSQLRLPTHDFDPRRTFRIKKEITGQHMVQYGGLKGFRDYETSVYAAASKNLKSKRKKP